MASRPSATHLVLLCLAVLCGAAGCSALRGAESREGPFLRPGSLLPPAPGRAVSPAERGGFAAPAARQASVVPSGLTNGGGMLALPGAAFPGVGPVRALVLSVSHGPYEPMFGEAELQERLVGDPTRAGTLVHALGRESGGLFRLTAKVMPTLVDMRGGGTDARALFRRGSELLAHWGRQIDLAEYDNDGPDGLPGSEDDDGRLDLVVVAVETAEGFPSVTVRGEVEVRSGGRTLRVSALHFVSVARSGGVSGLGARAALGLVLDAAGLAPEERFFDEGAGRTVSTLARARLGWIPVVAAAGGAQRMEASKVLVLPVQDMPAGTGFWLIERDQGRVYASRIARRPDGHFVATEVQTVSQGAANGAQLVLTRQLGRWGPHAVVSWGRGESAPRVEVVDGRPAGTAGAGAHVLQGEDTGPAAMVASAVP